MRNALIVGYGVVGRNLSEELYELQPDIYDKYRTEHNSACGKKYEIAFICVPTPYFGRDNPCDASEVKAAIAEHDAELYVIKSAILPGTTDRLRAETGKRVIVSPEYLGETAHSRNFDFNYTILGGVKEDCLKAVQILQRCYDGRHSFRITDAKTAELVKYMENSYLAAQVSFCAQFWEISKNAGVNYEELRELFILDPRVNPSHTFVFNDAPYWDSDCLNKDVMAITDEYGAELLSSVISYNDRMKRENAPV